MIHRIRGRLNRYWERHKHQRGVKKVKQHSTLIQWQAPIKGEGSVLCLVKDGMEHLDSFVKHYQELGFRHFVFLDNGSSDKTIDYLKSIECTVYKCRLNYEKYIYAMKQFMVHSLGENHWSLYVDVDELWLYPGMKTLSLKDFLEYLDHHSFNACQGHMLDMFGETISFNNQPLNAVSLQQAYPYFTLRGLIQSPLQRYFIQSDGKRFQYHGGVNKHFFDLDKIYLSKIPLIKWNRKMIVHESSHISKYIQLADVSCALLHYKFTNTFFQKAQKIVNEKRDAWAVEYYGQILDALDNKNTSLVDESTCRFESAQQLIQLGFIDVSSAFLSFESQMNIND